MVPEADLKMAYQHDDIKFLSELVTRAHQYSPKKLGIRSR